MNNLGIEWLSEDGYTLDSAVLETDELGRIHRTDLANVVWNWEDVRPGESFRFVTIDE